MPKKYGQKVGSKWIKTNILLKNNDLAPYIPETKVYDKKTLVTMLDKYQMVYLKPDKGSQGKGVIRLDKLTEGNTITYKYQLDVHIKTFDSLEKTVASLSKITAKKKYLIQRGIHMLQYQKRPFDIRIMVQLNPEGKWETTGMIGRVAPPNKIVSNAHQGGTALSIDILLASHMPLPIMKQRYLQFLSKLGVNTALHLYKKYPELKELGIDIGIDKNDVTPWILEVNTYPALCGFKLLENKQIHEKMFQYAKQYGRY